MAEEPGMLQSMGLQRLRHNLVTEQQQSMILEPPCYRLNVFNPSQSISWDPNPQSDGIWRLGIWRWSHKGGVLMNGMSVLRKGTPGTTSSAIWGHSEKTAVYEPGSGFSLNTQSAGALTFQPPELWEINVCGLNLPSLWHFYYSSLNYDMLWIWSWCPIAWSVWSVCSNLVIGSTLPIFILAANHILISLLFNFFSVSVSTSTKSGSPRELLYP